MNRFSPLFLELSGFRLDLKSVNFSPFGPVRAANSSGGGCAVAKVGFLLEVKTAE